MKTKTMPESIGITIEHKETVSVSQGETALGITVTTEAAFELKEQLEKELKDKKKPVKLDFKH